MVVRIEDNVFVDVTTAVRAPSDMEIEFRRNELRQIGQAFDFFEPANLKDLGLPADVDRSQVEEVVQTLQAQPDASNEEMTKTVAGSRLGVWLGNTDSVLKVATTLIALVKAGGNLFK